MYKKIIVIMLFIVSAHAYAAAPDFDAHEMIKYLDRVLTEHGGSLKGPFADIASRRSGFRPCDASFKPVAVVYRHDPSEVFSAVQKGRQMLADVLVRITGNKGNISDGDADEVCELARDMYDALSSFPALQTSFCAQTQVLQINTASLELLQSLLADILKKLPGKEIQLSADLEEALKAGNKRKRFDDVDALPVAKRLCVQDSAPKSGAAQ